MCQNAQLLEDHHSMLNALGSPGFSKQVETAARRLSSTNRAQMRKFAPMSSACSLYRRAINIDFVEADLFLIIRERLLSVKSPPMRKGTATLVQPMNKAVEAVLLCEAECSASVMTLVERALSIS
jgi:hypothetical protein